MMRKMIIQTRNEYIYNIMKRLISFREVKIQNNYDLIKIDNLLKRLNQKNNIIIDYENNMISIPKDTIDFDVKRIFDSKK